MGKFNVYSDEEVEQMHKQILWPTVRIAAKGAWGSGTLVYSKPDKKGKYHSYVVTCVPPTTPITTMRGHIPIKDIKEGDYVLTHKNRWRKVIKVMKRMAHEQRIRISVSKTLKQYEGGIRVPYLTCTPEHPILVNKNGYKQWVKAKNLKEGDKVYTETKLCECGELIPYYLASCDKCHSVMLEETMREVARERYGKFKNKVKLSSKWEEGKSHSPKITFDEHILPSMQKLEKEGFRCIPVGHYKVVPDIIAIKDGKVIAVEVEHGRSKSEFYQWSKKDKYDNVPYYDDTMWIERKKGFTRLDYSLSDNNLALMKLQKVKLVGLRKSEVWNIEVEEDNSYIAGGIVVHNCHHVIEDNIVVKTEFDQKVGFDIKREKRTPVEVQFFHYENLSICLGSAGSCKADIVCYDSDADIALLELRRGTEVGPVAYLLPKDKIDRVHVFDKVWACGAAMAHEPITTEGMINFMNEPMEYGIEYWMSNAQIIFGNSGGAVFKYSSSRDKFEFIGIPAAIVVNIQGFSQDAITHMGFFVPVTKIYKMIDKYFYNFIYDEKVTYEECEESRKKDKEKQMKLLMARYGGESKKGK